jgi:hypothetical protein
MGNTKAHQTRYSLGAHSSRGESGNRASRAAVRCGHIDDICCRDPTYRICRDPPYRICPASHISPSYTFRRPEEDQMTSGSPAAYSMKAARLMLLN